MPSLSKGDKVEWNTPQGTTRGSVVRKVTTPTRVGGHRAVASPEAPEYEVKSAKSGKAAIHRASALRRVARRED